MRHRSVIAFVLVAAALIAVPQASQDLSALKSALGARISSEIWLAFLNLNARDGVIQAAPRRTTVAVLASCAGKSPSETQTAGLSKKTVGRASAQVEMAPALGDAPVSDAPELAMMLTVPADTVQEEIERTMNESAEPLTLGRVLKSPARAPAAELAMIIPPGEGVDPVITRRLEASKQGEALASLQRAAKLETQVSYIVSAAFMEQSEEIRKSSEAIRGRLNNLSNNGAPHAPAIAAPRVKAIKIGRLPVTNMKVPVAVTSGQPKQLACIVSEIERAELHGAAFGE